MISFFEKNPGCYKRIGGTGVKLLCYFLKYLLYFDKFCGIILGIVLCVFIPFYRRAWL